MALSLVLFGALGPEAEALITRLADSDLAITRLQPIALDAAGDTVMWRGRPLAVQEPQAVDFDGVDVAVFLGDGQLSERCLEQAQTAGVAILDASDTLAQRGEGSFYYAGASWSAEQRQVAIADAVSSHCAALLSKLSAVPRRLQLAVCLPVSCHGQAGIDTLAAESARLLNGQPLEDSPLGQQIAFNLLPDPGARFAGRIEYSLGQLLGSGVEVLCQCVTAPVFFGHHVSLIAEYADAPDIAQLRQALAADSHFRPMANDAEHTVSVARLQNELGIEIAELRLDSRSERRLRCTLVGDNLRDGVVSNILSILTQWQGAAALN